MISKIELGSVEQKNKYAPGISGKNVSDVKFTGLVDGLLSGAVKTVQVCEAHPMVNVSVLDCTTAIFPRTIIETVAGSKDPNEKGENKRRKFNIFGGFEAFRRESSGLFINCLIPSFIVIGVAKLLNRPIMGSFKASDLTKSWANSESLDKIQNYYLASKGVNAKERIYNTLHSLINDISGVDGKEIKNLKDILAKNPDDYRSILEQTSEKIVNGIPKSLRKGIWSRFKTIFSGSSEYTQDLYNYLVKNTGIAENIKFAGKNEFSTSNLHHICTSAGEVLHGIVKEGIVENDAEIVKYFSKAKKLVTGKSAIGLLGVIIPLAISAQPINRWITHKLSGKKGAPIYNDDRERHLTHAEKNKLTAEKFFAVPLMWAVAGLSMLLDRPSLKMFQFKGIFPTMDQARIISAATFSSRIAASEDSNELKENTIRDIATFSSFYFLGDYAAKAIATLLEKINPDVTLINRLKDKNENANILQKLWHWAKHTAMKSSDELEAISDAALRTKSTNLRALCQLGNLAFSLLSLGIFIPLYTRTQTNKKKQLEMEKDAKILAASATFTSKLSKSQAFKSFTLVENQKVS